MKIDRTGCTRIVFLTKHYALKVPNFLDGWKLFLNGLLANLQESNFWQNGGYYELCPIRYATWGGWLVIMRKAQVLTDEEFLAMDIDAFLNKEHYVIPAEKKANSFGWLDGRVVAIDYGN